MFDLKAIRDNPAAFDAGLKRRGLDAQSSSILALDEKRRALITTLQEAQGRRNAASKEIGKAKGAKDEALAAKLMAEVAGLKDTVTSGEADQAKLDAEIEAMLAVIPNIPLAEVPDGVDEHGNKEIRKVGTPNALIQKAGVNKPKQHFEIGEALGMMDFETAAKVSGARFVFLKGQLARLERALAQFMLDTHTEQFGYIEVVPPMLVREETAFGTGNLPKFRDQLFVTSLTDKDPFAPDTYKQTLMDALRALVAADPLTQPKLLSTLSNSMAGSELKANLQNFFDTLSEPAGNAFETSLLSSFDKLKDQTRELFLIPTAEVSLTNLAREQIIDEEKLPLRFTACTPCFRSEAGAAGRDTRGMIRQHQFSKVELVSITTPEKSLEEHERMTNAAETILQKLGLAYRTMLLCTGDMGFASQKTYDIEVWLPGQDAYREISSCSVCGDFQARRMAARYRPKGAKDVRYVHTLNGSGLAVGRTLVAILENYQQPDGSVAIPEVLQPYMGGKTVIAKA